MEFYNNKFSEIRKIKKIKANELAKKLEINRSTLWLWESGRVKPSPKKIKTIAKILNISLDSISDIKPDIEKSESELGKYKDVISSWISSTDNELKSMENETEKYINNFRKQLKEKSQAVSLARALINFADVMLYIKDVNQKYIAASKTFLEHISVKDEKKIIEKNDFQLFTASDAKLNLEEDEQVMFSGNALCNKEGLIPGSRKKKWGIISKIPTFDSNGKVTGLIGSFIDITARRKNEILIEQFKKALGLMDEAIWIGKNARVKPDGRIAIDNFIYSVDEKLRKALFIENKNLSTEELWNYAETLIIEEDKRKKIKLEDIFNKNQGEIRLRLSLPESNKIVYVKIRIYYDSESEIFVWLASEDTETKKLADIRNKLVELGLEEDKIDFVLGDNIHK